LRKAHVTDGPFAETKELVAGYTLIQVNRGPRRWNGQSVYPNPAGEAKEAEIEVRQRSSWRISNPGEAIERFRELDAAKQR